MVNREIQSKVVKVVGDAGLTQMSLDEAIELAEESGEDVVQVGNDDEIAVVKIIDYSKYLYDKQKREKENKKKNKANAQELKQVQISDSIAEHDLQIKAKNIDRILTSGDKVKLVIKYRGRAVRLIEQGPSKLQYLANMISVKYSIESTPKIEGNRVSMVISPCK